MPSRCSYRLFFFFNDTATTEIYTLSLHDALPICQGHLRRVEGNVISLDAVFLGRVGYDLISEQPHVPLKEDRKSTRLNSSHGYISYAVFCLKKKKVLAVLVHVRERIALDLLLCLR